ncbi:unnamed protein product, partial [Musa textilis]
MKVSSKNYDQNEKIHSYNIIQDKCLKNNIQHHTTSSNMKVSIIKVSIMKVSNMKV